MPTPNSWLNLKQKASGIIPPVVALRDQAQLLTEATEGVLQGGLTTTSKGATVRHQLVMVPAMNNYTVTLVTMMHSIALYPGPNHHA